MLLVLFWLVVGLLWFLIVVFSLGLLALWAVVAGFVFVLLYVFLHYVLPYLPYSSW